MRVACLIESPSPDRGPEHRGAALSSAAPRPPHAPRSHDKQGKTLDPASSKITASAADGTKTPPATPLGVLSPGFFKLFLGFFFCVLNLNLFALVPYYLQLRGASELLYGTTAGMVGLGGLSAMALFGGRTDRLTRRSATLRYFVASLAANVVALVAMGLPPAWYLLAAGLHGVMGGVGLPVVFVWASELGPPDRRTQTFAWLGVAGLLGDSLGPLLGESLLFTQPDPQAPSAFLVVFIAASVLWLLSFACFVAAPDAPRAAGFEKTEGFLPLVRLPELRTMLLAAVAFGGALGVMLSLGKNFVASIGLQFVSVLLGAHTAGALLVRVALPWLLMRFDRVRLVPVAFSGVALSMALLAVTDGYGMLALSGLIYGLSHGLLFPTLLARLMDFGGAEAAGRISTLYMGLFSLGLGLLPALGGVVLPVGGFSALFLGASATCLAGLALTRFAERLHRRRPAAVA